MSQRHSLHVISSLCCLRVCFSIFHLRFEPEARRFNLRYSVSTTKIKLWKNYHLRRRFHESKNLNWLQFSDAIPIHQHIVQYHFNKLYQIRYINKNNSLAVCRLGWKFFTIYETVPKDDRDHLLSICKNPYAQYFFG